MSNQKVELAVGGREFMAVGSTTLRHDLATQRELHRAGLEGMQMTDDEGPQQFALRLVRAACVNGDLPALLGCLLMPRGSVRWSPQIAADTAEFLGELEDPDDKKQVQAAISSVLFSFMAAGMLSSTVSTISSLTAEDEHDRPNATRPSQSTESGQI